ncbi:conjugation system SOS inhibitor PsiB [Scandinavium goeteborgense]|uniref:SOS inhibition protein PsiB n=1 Tax=Scandinavium goeteborgense TaxID=1851514 RepID=A0A4R6E1F4_SCAGO|nr:conjugation system SOS inhibitor PsiB [Scandinavium goeteborgense]TDN51513.1 SOS inhibition protein PsiB [Scandinavium goeteborgense]
MNTVFETESISGMAPDEFEHIREAGFEFRSDLTHAVMCGLTIPSGWQASGEYRSEFGGWFPVQVRFSPQGGAFRIEVCSPGEISQDWLIVVVSGNGQSVSVVRQLAQFDGDIISHVIALAASLHGAGYSLCHILATLGMEGGL